MLRFIYLAVAYLTVMEFAFAADRRPNVLVILSDDQGYGDVSAHGNPVLKTPNLDKLHGESVRLTDFHVAPMCTPTRGQLLSGRDALHTGASSVCAGRSFLPRGTPTMAEIFRASGYRTGLFGKWHLGDSYPNLPHQRGFEETVYHLGWGITSMADTWLNDCFDGRFFHNGKLQKVSRLLHRRLLRPGDELHARPQSGRGAVLRLLADERAARTALGRRQVQGAVRGKVPPPVAPFFGMIANLDENLGRLDAFLRESGLYDDTIVFYFNDNGATAGRSGLQRRHARAQDDVLRRRPSRDGLHPLARRQTATRRRRRRVDPSAGSAADAHRAVRSRSRPTKPSSTARASPAAARHARKTSRADDRRAVRPGAEEVGFVRAVGQVAARARHGAVRRRPRSRAGTRRRREASRDRRQASRALRTMVGRRRAAAVRLQPDQHRRAAREPGDALRPPIGRTSTATT